MLQTHAHICRHFSPHRRVLVLIPIKRTEIEPIALKFEPEVFKEKSKFLSLMERVMLEERLAMEELKTKYGKNIPYDVHLQTCQKKVNKRICKVCIKYHATAKSLKEHMKVCKRSKSNDGPAKKVKRKGRKVQQTWLEESDESDKEEDINASFVDQEHEDNDNEHLEIVTLPVTHSIVYPGQDVETILNLREWLKSPWQAMHD